ncbi:MAG: hypothetical protein F4213_20300 [Boseongicola sp. SB0677_bin_26]|nr:hypothetical protein [Boseongicola sp. SB0665_bin_10]MYG28327.1 hypothetical protein [Boseongicola sp. SB0677_bin_26]
MPMRTASINAAFMLASFTVAAAAQDGDDLAQEWGQRIHKSCGSSGNGFDQCVADLLADTAAEHAVQVAAREGRSVFGEKFQVLSRMTIGPSSGLTGDLDVVIPLSGATEPVVHSQSALFLQQGITSWRDSDGTRRNDIRVGMVYRLPVLEGDALGFSLFHQENLERDHQRAVAGLDYAGRWGTAYVSAFEPTTGWRPGRTGYKERARSGTEFGAQLHLTSTVAADAAWGRWEAREGHIENVRIGLDWKPHPHVSFGAGYEVNHVLSGPPKDGARLSMAFNIPLGQKGGGSSRAKWEGLGVPAFGEASPDFWAPITNVGRIVTLERAIAKPSRVKALVLSADLPEGVTVQFLQDHAETGSRIGVRISIPDPLSEDLRLVVRLVPGSGDNPAVPGEDFVDEPHHVTIKQGEVAADTSLRLLHNDDMQLARSLAVEVSLAS